MLKKHIFQMTVALIILVILGVTGLVLFMFNSTSSSAPQTYGATFSITYAEYLELDWKEAYIDALDEMEVRHFRIPIYWSRVEAEQGNFDFSEIDWLMDEADSRGAKVTLVTGMKVPRWPECFVPEWAGDHSPEELTTDILVLIDETVNRYKNHNALEKWQVENEPFFPFGICPKMEKGRYPKEVALVREIDPDHPIQTTTSGEQSIWATHAKGVDVVGASLYRIVYAPVIGYVVFPIPSFIYTIQSKITQYFGAQVIISELQAEPWLPPNADSLSVEQKADLFTERHLSKHIRYAKRTGIKEVYVWGIEWWYFLKLHDHPALWDAGVDLFKS